MRKAPFQGCYDVKVCIFQLDKLTIVYLAFNYILHMQILHSIVNLTYKDVMLQCLSRLCSLDFPYFFFDKYIRNKNTNPNFQETSW